MTSIQTQSARASREFYAAVTGHLLEAEKAAGVGHHVALSIVGVDKAPYGYYAGKALQELLVTEGGVPWTILRATQFHEFASQVMKRLKLGRWDRPPDAVPAGGRREIAERLMDIVEDGPSGRVPDLGGPRDEQVVDMVRALKAATGAKGWILPLPFPGALGRALRDGSLIPGPAADHGTQTYAEWLRSSR